MTKAQEALVEQVRQALYDDPDVPIGVYVGRGHMTTWVERFDIIDGLIALFNEKD